MIKNKFIVNSLILICILAVTLFIIVFTSKFGYSVATFIALPIILIAWNYDIKGGIIAGITAHFYIILIHIIFLNTPILYFIDPLNLVSIIIDLIIGLIIGTLSYLRKKLNFEIEERIKAENKLKYFINVDALTNIVSRKLGMEILEDEIKIWKPALPLTICYLDINSLKFVNDNYGHFQGDLLIKKVVDIIEPMLDPLDTFIRLGGDEFLLVMANKDINKAKEKIFSINNMIASTNKRNEKPYNFSVSFGITEYKPNMTKDEFLKEADKEMYEEKRKYYKNKILEKEVL